MEEIARAATRNRVIGEEREGVGFKKMEQEVS